MAKARSQRELARILLKKQGILRLGELREAGVTAATMSRMVRAGEVLRLARGIYQLADADLDPNHSLAEAAKRVPKGVVCLVSALAFHGLTDQLSPKVWMAIGPKDWAPQRSGAGIRIVRFTDPLLREGIETHSIEGVSVNIFGVAKTVADCFRHRGKVGLTIAIEGLREALRQGKATPAEIARHADAGGVSTVIRPYLEALTANA
jgi:predicted transcriptional regulator of viral defense system